MADESKPGAPPVAPPPKSDSASLSSDQSLQSEASIRRDFVQKVYSILACQLLVTCGFIALFVFCKPVRAFAIRFQWLYIVAFAALLILIIILACFQGIRRRFPLNLILLAVFTVIQSFALGVVSARFQTDTVLIAVGVTAVVALALTLFALQTKLDFTYLTGILFVLLIVLLMFGILCAIFQNRYATLAYSCLGALLFSVYLVVDTQMILGGKHRYSVSPEEYIFAALSLYLDIVHLFLFILSIVSGIKD